MDFLIMKVDLALQEIRMIATIILAHRTRELSDYLEEQQMLNI